jgi:NUBPL iron-transfer P-loop NTPase
VVGRHFSALIKQLLDDVYWDSIDYLLIDTPPGTSDEHITVVEALRDYKPDGSILVTTPQVTNLILGRLFSLRVLPLSGQLFAFAGCIDSRRPQGDHILPKSGPAHSWNNRKHEWIRLSKL